MEDVGEVEEEEVDSEGQDLQNGGEMEGGEDLVLLHATEVLLPEIGIMTGKETEKEAEVGAGTEA